MKNVPNYGPTLLRVALGGLFVSAGTIKMMGIESVVTMLGGIGFPMATIFAWVLALSEVIFGAAVLAGFRLNHTVWPLVLIMTVALLRVTLPGWLVKGGNMSGIFFHLLAIAALISLYWSGPGAYAVKIK